MNELSKQPQDSRDAAEDLNWSATKAFLKLLPADKTLLPAWKDAAPKLLENGVPQDADALKTLLEGGNCLLKSRWLPIMRRPTQTFSCQGMGFKTGLPQRRRRARK